MAIAKWLRYFRILGSATEEKAGANSLGIQGRHRFHKSAHQLLKAANIGDLIGRYRPPSNTCYVRVLRSAGHQVGTEATGSLVGVFIQPALTYEDQVGLNKPPLTIPVCTRPLPVRSGL